MLDPTSAECSQIGKLAVTDGVAMEIEAAHLLAEQWVSRLTEWAEMIALGGEQEEVALKEIAAAFILMGEFRSIHPESDVFAPVTKGILSLLQ